MNDSRVRILRVLHARQHYP
ncbi:hypothetical protein [Sphingomonas sp. LT1P40]